MTQAVPNPALGADIARGGGSRLAAVVYANHALHDGLSSLLLVLLPLWQAGFGLSYGEVGFLRSLYTACMAFLQIPSSGLARRYGAVALLVGGTAAAGIGFLAMGASGSIIGLAVGLMVAGAGSSTQHPIGSELIARVSGGATVRARLATYNFAGDLGKMALPALTGLALAAMAWRQASFLIGVVGIVAALAVALALRGNDRGDAAMSVGAERGADVAAAVPPPSAFRLLLAIGIIDTTTRSGFVTFLPFLLRARGVDLQMVGFALTLVFVGGAAGKLVCGRLAIRVGVLWTVLLTEGATAIGIASLIVLPATVAFLILPLVGVALNGTSSAIYGSVPELVPATHRAKAFGIFYTGTIGAGALSPVAYGLFGDSVGVETMILVVAAMVISTLPLAVLFARAKAPSPKGS